MNHDLQITISKPGLGQHNVDAVQNALLGGPIVCQHLGRVQARRGFQGDIREGAPDIGAKPDLRGHILSFAARAASRIWERVWRGVSASGLMFRSNTAPVREARARANAAGKSSVRSTRSA